MGLLSWFSAKPPAQPWIEWKLKWSTPMPPLSGNDRMSLGAYDAQIVESKGRVLVATSNAILGYDLDRGKLVDQLPFNPTIECAMPGDVA